QDAVVDCRDASVGEVDDVMHVACAPPTAREPTSPAIAHHDRSTLRSAPDGCSCPEVERLARSSHEMTDDSAVTGHAAEGLETDRRAVDQLGDTSPAAKARRTVGRRRISWATRSFSLAVPR